MDEFTWLTYPATGGVFRCPTPAVEAWTDNGWEPCEAPEEINPAVVERIAAQRAQAAQDQAADPGGATDHDHQGRASRRVSGVSNG